MLQTPVQPSTRSHRAAVIAVAGILAAAGPSISSRVHAQNPGMLSGTVYDPTGAVLPGVELKLEDAQQVVVRARSDSSGQFRFEPVSPGRYRLEASIAGFNSLARDLDLRQSGNWNQPVTLQVGTLQETISVRESRASTPRPAAAPAPPRIGGNIRTPKKLVHVSPEYPAALREAGIDGLVPLDALIGRDGNVAAVRVLSAAVHPELAKSAIDAVRKWQFSPTLLNGEPIDVWMTVSVRFSLGDQ